MCVFGTIKFANSKSNVVGFSVQPVSVRLREYLLYDANTVRWWYGFVASLHIVGLAICFRVLVGVQLQHVVSNVTVNLNNQTVHIFAKHKHENYSIYCQCAKNSIIIIVVIAIASNFFQH